MSEAIKTGEVRLIDGEIVPSFDDVYDLPIRTHRPHKWAMVDMESGAIYILDPNSDPDAAKFKILEAKDISRMKRIVKALHSFFHHQD